MKFLYFGFDFEKLFSSLLHRVGSIELLVYKTNVYFVYPMPSHCRAFVSVLRQRKRRPYLPANLSGIKKAQTLRLRRSHGGVRTCPPKQLPPTPCSSFRYI